MTDRMTNDYRDAECILLAELIQSPEFIAFAQKHARAEMFNSNELRDVWRLITEMDERREQIDIVTVGSRIPSKVVVELTAPQYNRGLATFSTVEAHCAALKENYIKRTVSEAAARLYQGVADGTPAADLMAMADKLSETLRQGLTFSDTMKPLSDVNNEHAEVLRKMESGEALRIPTGFEGLDSITYSGFCPGSLIILAARPSVGKTAVMLQMAMAAAKSGKTAFIFSLEMMNTELIERMLVSTGKIYPSEMRFGKVNWKSYEAAGRDLDGMKMYFNDKAHTIDEIASAIYSARGKCDIAFIDYLGLIQGGDPRKPLSQSIAEKTARLKQLAKDCNIPIVLLCQLNRDSDTMNRAPELRDVRDSGAIEQDADIVLMLERLDNVVSGTSNKDLKMWVRKNRNGKAGNCCKELRPNETYSRFAEIEQTNTH